MGTLFILGPALDTLDTLVSEYASYTDAIRDGAIARGWLPPFIPTTATVIREVHNIDTNEQWLSFSLPSQEVHTLSTMLTTISLDEARTSLYRVDSKVGDWPPELSTKKPGRQPKSEHLTTLRTVDGVYGVAIDKRKNRIYVWSTTSAG